MTLNRLEFAYLQPVAACIYPADAAEFRRIYQQPNTLAPEFRQEGLAAMTDAEVVKLAAALQQAVIEDPAKIAELWEIVCTHGYRSTFGAEL